MGRRITPLLLIATSIVSAAEFHDRQAARAVIGQPSFSAHEKGVVARALTVSKGNLYVADVSGQLLVYDLSRLGAGRSGPCPVCVATPQSTVAQNVFEGVGATAANGSTIAVADNNAHRVMIWRGVSGLQTPDVTLTAFIKPTSVALDEQRLYVGDAGSHHVYIWNSIPTADAQPPDVTLGVPEGVEGPGADTMLTPAALASDGANLYVADSSGHRVLIFSPVDAAAPKAANAATLKPGPLAPGTLVTLEPVSSGKATVVLNGRPILVTERNGDQLQIQIPSELNNSAAGSLSIRSELEDGSVKSSAPLALRFVPASPGIFAFGPKEPRTGLLLHAPAGMPLSPEDPGKAGELLTVWATGLGAVAADSNAEGSFDVLTQVRATVGGNPVEVVSAVLPAAATGVYEVRLRLPAKLARVVNLVLSQNDVKSNVVTFPVQSNHP